ncbi:MAG: CBS domain-containing protein [Planctomycetes bacterium]|nr:CBS domain-containing protein [Planctomycetota bacterium]
MNTRKVHDIMLSLSDYAVVGEEATLVEALAALERAQADLTAGRQPHRAVLVQDSSGAIVGKLDHLAFLRALLLEHRPWTHQKALDMAGVSDEMKQTSADMLGLFEEDVRDLCERARNTRVSDVCTRTTASIDHESSLVDAIRAFLAHRTLSLLVTAGRRTVGLLRLADLFDELARTVRQDKGGARQE